MSSNPTPADGPQDTGQTLADVFGMNVITGATRAQLLADGFLKAVPEQLLADAGILLPTALTAAAWADCVEWSDADSDAQTPQDETGRLFDVLITTAYAARTSKFPTRQVTVDLNRIPRDGISNIPRPARLKAVCGPGDNAEPVLTIMRPDED